MKKYGRQMAFGVMLCICSPIILFFLNGMADYKGDATKISDNMVAGIGIISLLTLVAIAVFIFIIISNNMKKYEYISKSQFTYDYGVKGIIKEKKEMFSGIYIKALAIGVVICILSVIPLFISIAIDDKNEFLMMISVCLLFFIVSIGVYILVAFSMCNECYNQLLMENEYSKDFREANEKNELFGGIYWPLVVVIYLVWSFASNYWHITWLVWPIASLLFASIMAALKIKSK